MELRKNSISHNNLFLSFAEIFCIVSKAILESMVKDENGCVVASLVFLLFLYDVTITLTAIFLSHKIP